MEHMTVGQIVNACKGTLLLGEPDIVVKHISLNSRTMKRNEVPHLSCMREQSFTFFGVSSTPRSNAFIVLCSAP